jgi:mannose-1-phosphate guanylyltransferase
VEDPSRFGVVVCDKGTGAIEQLVEKPQTFVGNCINAGVYLLSLDVINYIKGDDKTPCSIEREVFPAMANDKVLFALELPGYWADVGQPADYITGLVAHLDDIAENEKSRLAVAAEGYKVVGNCLIDPSVKIGAGSTIGPAVTLGPNCTVGEHTVLTNAAIFNNVAIGSNCNIKDSIISHYCVVKDNCKFSEVTVLGQAVTVADGVTLSNVQAVNSFTIKASAKDAKVWC